MSLPLEGKVPRNEADEVFRAISANRPAAFSRLRARTGYDTIYN
jgi:hypothetical protein